MRKRKKSLPMLSGPRIILSLTRVKSRLPSKLWGSFRMIFQLNLICILKNPKMPWQKLSRTRLRFKKVSKRSQKITDLWVEDLSKWSEMEMDLFHQDVELKENQGIRIDFLLDQVVDKKSRRKSLPKFLSLRKENLFQRAKLHRKVSENSHKANLKSARKLININPQQSWNTLTQSKYLTFKLKETLP